MVQLAHDNPYKQLVPHNPHCSVSNATSDSGFMSPSFKIAWWSHSTVLRNCSEVCARACVRACVCEPFLCDSVSLLQNNHEVCVMAYLTL